MSDEQRMDEADLVIEPWIVELTTAFFLAVAVIALSVWLLPGAWRWITPLALLGPPLIMLLLTPRWRGRIGQLSAAVLIAVRVMVAQMRGWWARRRQRWAAAGYAFGRWIRLAVGRKQPEHLAEMASVQGFLAATPFSPFRLIAILAGGGAAIFAGLWGWAAAVTVPSLRQALDVERRNAAIAIQANAALVQRVQAAEIAAAQASDAIEAQARLALTTTAASARRAQARNTARARANQQQQEILDAGRRTDDAEPFDGDRWLRERAARGDNVTAAVSGVPAAEPAAAAANGMPDGARADAQPADQSAQEPR
jgi:hypothetical protein